MRKVVLVVLLALSMGVSTVEACSVPVFRYALERWPAGRYEVLLLHRGALGEDDAKLRDWLRACADGLDARTNMDLLELDVDKETEGPYAKVIARHVEAPLPRLVVRFPATYPVEDDVWAGPLDAADAQALVDSPARRKIGLGILGGQAAVWLLLESGDKAKDDAAAALVSEQIAKLKDTLHLPELLPEDVLDGAEPPAEMKVDFSMVRVSRTDPAEKLLVAILLAYEPELKRGSEPMLFPVIGQGLVLPPLIGKGISRSNVSDAATFIVGECSCWAKEQIRGLDLLMSVDWMALPDGQWVKPIEPPPLSAAPAPATIEKVGVARGDEDPSDTGQPQRWGLFSISLAALAGVGILTVVIASVLISRRASRGEG
ncbi:MAG TPA: hypothetical protein VMY39_02180 [Planctomycetota bacterium]|nr:hypothetical protein [Planctomycetota bacterium]